MKEQSPSKTFMGNVVVDTIPILIILKNTKRLGFFIVNRSATTLYLAHDVAITAGSGSTVRLLQNEIFTLLESEGDDPTEEMYGLASGTSTVDIVESVRF